MKVSHQAISTFISDSMPLAVYSLLLACALFILEYPRQLINALGVDGSPEEENIYGSTSQQIGQWLNTVSQLPYASDIATVLFWTFVAVVAYRLYIYVSNLFVFLHNEAVLQREYNDQAQREPLTYKAIKRLSVALIYLLYVGICLVWLVPVSVATMGHLVDEDFSIQALPYFFAGLVSLWAALYILFVWSRLVFRYERAL